MSTLFDKHAEVFKEAFAAALPFDAYVRSGSALEQDRWRSGYKSAFLTDEQQILLSSFKRKQNILVLSGLWCGDCARSGPLLAKIAESASSLDLRFLESRNHPQLADELRIHGASRVPVVVTLSEDFFEVSRFGDRTLSVYRRKMLSEMGPTCEISSPGADAISDEMKDWIAHVERSELLLRLSGLLRNRYGD